MKQIDKLNRRLLCRDGPRLEMSSSIPIDHCVDRIGMDTCLNSTARFFGNASAVTVARVTDATLENFSANVRNGCSMASTSHQTVQSVHRMLCRSPVDQKNLTPASMNQEDRHGRNAMTGIWNITRPEEENDLSMTRYHDLESPKQFSRDMFRTMTCLEEC